MHGGRCEPWPTPITPPRRSASSCAPARTFTFRPDDRPTFRVSAAISAGDFAPAGSFTRSRAQPTASAILAPRCSPALTFAPPRPSTTTRASFDGFGSLVAHVVEVTVKGGVVKVNRVVAAVDCGVVVSPSGVMAQIEGTVVDGISTALHAGITIAGGGVEQKNFYDYPWIRMAEMPHVEVHLVPSGDSPGGMGEPGYPSVPPAVMNAVFAATGKRIRRLPMREGDLA